MSPRIHNYHKKQRSFKCYYSRDGKKGSFSPSIRQSHLWWKLSIFTALPVTQTRSVTFLLSVMREQRTTLNIPVLFLSICMHVIMSSCMHTQLKQAPAEASRGCHLPRAAVTGGYEPPHVGAGNWPHCWAVSPAQTVWISLKFLY